MPKTQALIALFFSALQLCSLSHAATEDELLDPNIAFVVTANLVDSSTLAVNYAIEEGYYLYRHRFNFAIDTEGVTLGDPQIPDGKKKTDEFFGEVETYRHHVQILLPFQIRGEVPESLVLQAGLQGCADIGVCYPPFKQTVSVPFDGTPAGTALDTTKDSPDAYVSEQDRIANTLAQGKTLVILISFFGFGLLLAFTPCVFPMIPILSGIIVGQGESLTTFKAFVLSVVYVLAMALTYTIVGVIVGRSGENIQALFQNPTVLFTFAGIFVLLSLSMFGFYELQMPNSVQSKLTSISNSQSGGTFLGVAIMGFLSALIVGPCVTAPLIGALIYIAQTGDEVLGGMALFSLSLGMGLPLILIGTSAGKLLPKAGAWMDAIKSVFGVSLLAVAVWLLERVLSGTVIMAMWATLLIVPSMYLVTLEPASVASHGWRSLWKGIGMLMLVYGVLLMIGAASGNTNPLKPLQQFGIAASSSSTSNARKLKFEPVKGLEGLASSLLVANNENKPAMLDFYADWCISCKEMEAFTFTDTNVQSILGGFQRLKTDVTVNDDTDKALLKNFGLFGPPAILFFTPDGKELPQFRVVGFMPADEFVQHVQQFLNTVHG